MVIHIFGPDSIWVGQGRVNEHGQIFDCPANLGEDEEGTEEVYCSIEQSIEQGFTSGTTGGYEWFLEDEGYEA